MSLFCGLWVELSVCAQAVAHACAFKIYERILIPKSLDSNTHNTVYVPIGDNSVYSHWISATHHTHTHIESICALYCLCFLLLLYLRRISVSLVHNRRTDVREWARASRCVCAQKSATTDQKRANMLYDCILKQLIWMPYAMLLLFLLLSCGNNASLHNLATR